MANFNTPYEIEREGQMEFFDNYGIPYNDDASILVDNTDGVYNGNIFEFKLNISNLNKTLFQAIKYLSKMRIKGESVPATILLIDLNATTVYVYKSENYRADIHKIYTGAASKDNDGFMAGKYDMVLDYSDMVQSAQVKKILKGRKVNPDEMYMPIDIDENCIVGWAERYYREKPKASKGDFLGDDTGTAVKVTGEIRDPRHFKGLINPYTGKSNEKFKYLMDCLNDRLSKKDLGAFYTPIPYARKAAELVQMAVDRVPDGNDYIILDRCAGTGNLEAALIGLTDKNGDDLIEHCVVSTYEYYEYKVLQERIGDKVRDIIPPSEANVIYENGKVANADAMSEDFINNPIIRQYVDNPKCTIILFENPPYSDSSAITFIEDGDLSKRAKTGRKGAFVLEEFKKDISGLGGQQAVTREVSNLFIWSAFKYYMREDTDSYIVFSPVKYYKNVHLVEKKCLGGFAFNRLHFHATPSVISCILWSNENDNSEAIALETYDIVSENTCHLDGRDIDVPKVYLNISDFSDKRTDVSDVEDKEGIAVVGADGFEKKDWKYVKGRQPKYNPDIIAYLVSKSFMIDPKHYNLVRTNFDTALKNAYGFWLRSDNYLEKLPMFVAKLLPVDYWYEKDVYFTTADGGDTYTKDPQFLKSCLIYTCLSNQNKCLSFDGSDGRRYQNELCFDNSKTFFAGFDDNGNSQPVPQSAIDALPLAVKDLNKYAMAKATALDDEEKKLLEVWNEIIAAARKTAGYNPDFNYGVYQISKELNTSKVVGTGKNKKTVYDYPELNGYLDTLRTMLKAYYKSHITEKMFEYELLK